MAKAKSNTDIRIQQPGKNVTIKRNTANPEALELIAEEIIKISQCMKLINEKTNLERRVILLLIRDITKLPLETIDQVLTASGELEMFFIKKKK